MRAVPLVAILIVLSLTTVAASAVAVVTASSTIADHLPHPPILIDGDDAFCKAGSGVRNCGSADGSADNPYVIRGWNIRAVVDTNSPAITIRDTTKHVVVENNLFRVPCADAVPAMKLENAAHVTLLANDVTSGLSSAIVATDVTDLELRANEVVAACANLTEVALVTVDGANGATFALNSYGGTTNEDALHANDLVRLTDATGVLLDRNDYHDARGTALSMTRVSVDEASGEVIRDVRYGLNVTEGGTLAFTDLEVSGVQNALTITDTWSLTLSQASLADNFPCDPACVPIGITVTNSHFTGEHITLSDFHTGLLVLDPSGTTSSTDDCKAKDDAAWEACEWTARIRYSNITGNSYAGVLVEDAAKVHVGSSDIHGNGVYGVASNSTKLVHAHKDWWGCSNGPRHADCDDVTSSVRTPAPQRAAWGW